MTSTIWTFGGGGAAADTFRLPHPTDNRRVQTTQPRAHNVVAKFRESLESPLCSARPRLMEDLPPDFEMCHWLRMACPSIWGSWVLSTAQVEGRGPPSPQHQWVPAASS